MSKLSNSPTALVILLCLLSFSVAAADIASDTNNRPDTASAVVTPSALPWPNQISTRDRRFVVYQPQFDKWEGDRLEGRAAVAVHAQANEQPSSFGMVWISARTETNRASGIVTIRDLAITKADFPTATDRAGDYLESLRQQLAAKSWQMPLERLQSDMAIDRAVQQAGRQPLRNDPPKIIFSERPAILVPVDGAPVLQEVPGTGLQRIVNTRALILYDPALNNPPSARYYLYVVDHWRQAQHLAGPWTASANPAADLEKARQLAVQQDQVDLLNDDVEHGEPLDASATVYVSTEPAELLQTDGPAQYAPIQDTQLLYVSNSPDRIFLDLRTANHYALISGRWYRARTLQRGPWEYVAAGNLPGDFALIPPDHATAPVRAAVPGTPQAREAVIANSVPQVATVTRSAASLEITYDGDPSFQPIAGTSLQSAVNSPVPVIRVSENSFYALDNGVWFTASSPFGPWSVATYVPAVVYTIPRSSPLHYVTYVRIYDATPEVVYEGYTPGYVGSYVSSDLVVVYGSGWYYRPWIGTVWYGSPVTWGFGFSIFYNWWNPWQPCCFAAFAPRPHFRPCWGPWNQHAWHQPSAIGSRVTLINNMTVNGDWRSHNVSNIYSRWDHNAVHAIAHDSIRPDRGERHAQIRPGSGFVVGPDGRRQDLVDHSGQRDWKDTGADAHNRAALPPIQRRESRRLESAGRRDQSMNQWQDSGRRDPLGRNFATLPPIQTPHRRSDANMAPINPGRESSQAARPLNEAPFTGQFPRSRQDIQERQRREPAMTQRLEPDRAQPQFRPQSHQLAEPSRMPGQAWQSAPREIRQERAAPSFPSAGAAPTRPPQGFREQRAQMPRVIPEARASGQVLRQRVERDIGAGAGRVESRPQFRGGESGLLRDRGAGASGQFFAARHR
jgi:hypothetical protein